jgi:GNAT superfamily N-acetyltransferase
MLQVRKAGRHDITPIVQLLADDMLGQSREQLSKPLATHYVAAFERIDCDPNQLLAVMVDGEDVVGTLQLTFIPGLSRQGAIRGQIEAVRIAADRRSAGLGEQLIEWAIGQCRERGCALVQLTTDRRRSDAHRFYERLGFEASHVGYKLEL